MNKKMDDNQKNQRIQVFARCRPLNSFETMQNSHSVIEVIPDKKITVKDRNVTREFLFDKVFPPNTTQDVSIVDISYNLADIIKIPVPEVSVYKSVVEPLIQEVLMGYNCTVFAYGQTGTGKTYTMEGERNNSKCSWEDDPGAGIIPRSLHQLFEALNKEENVEFSVKVSFLELYNEELFDLLNSAESKLRLYEKNGSTIVNRLQEFTVNSKDEVYSILERGTARRQTAATMLNATSSRSHTIFSVTVHIRENTIDGEELLVKTGKLNLVDLAGSENVGRSGAVDKRAREAGNINQSLLTLGRVITALIERQPHIPYRESKLTRILQDSLGGHTKTSIIATVSPAHCNFDETISTLDYATKAKSITIKPEANQKMTKRALIRELTEKIEMLQKDVVAAHSNEGFFVHKDNYTALLKEAEEKKELAEKIDLLKEEIIKVEEMFKETKDVLTVKNEKLNDTSQKYEETATKLSNTTNALCHTQKALTKTTLERDEKQFLINIQCNTEKRLSQQAQKLLYVANETTSDVDKLHAKIGRKDTIEKINEQRCEEFRMMYQKQFAMLDDLVSSSEVQQTANLSRTKEDIDKIFQFLQNQQKQTTNYLNQFVCTIIKNTEELSKTVTSSTNSQMEWTNSKLEELSSKKELLLNKQCSFLLRNLPELIHEMDIKNSEMKDWICNVHKHLSEKIENEKVILCERSEKRKELINSLIKSSTSLCKSYEDALEDFKRQRLDDDNKQNQYDKDIKEKLIELTELAESRENLRRTISKRDSFFIENIEKNSMGFQEVQEPLMKLYNSECVLEEKIALNKMLAIVSVDEFSRKQELLSQNQAKIISEFEKFTQDKQKDEESIFLETETALRSNLSTLSENAQSLETITVKLGSSIKHYAQSEKATQDKNNEEIKEIIHKIGENISGSEEYLCSVTSQLKEEILKRDIEFEKFISDDLLKDIPTGTTPQRKNYTYPRLLAATSPHDRILERFRSKLAADTAVAVDLPFNSSFSELDESSLPLNKNFDTVNDSNISFSGNESDDSCASYLSDASLESGKNKENQKKRSRLPKRLLNKGFVKPALPSTKMPLGLANSTTAEQHDD